MRPRLRRDDTAAVSFYVIAAVVIVASLVGVAVLAFAFPSSGRTLTVTFYSLTGGQQRGPPAVGVNVVIWNQTQAIASGTSGLDGKATFHGLPARTLGFRYGGGPWIYVAQAVDLTGGDLNIVRELLACPNPSGCGPSG